MPDRPSIPELTALLTDTHTSREMRSLARMVAEELVALLPEGAAPVEVAERLAEAVTHRGFQGRLHEQLRATRPGRLGEIDAVMMRANTSKHDAISDAIDAALREAEGEEGAKSLAEYLDGTGLDDEDLLYETYRAMAFGRSKAAWPYIAKMTAEYVRAGRPVDDFFRRVGWLLERCEAEDIRILLAAFALAGALLSQATTVTVVPEVQFLFDGSVLAIRVQPADGQMLEAFVSDQPGRPVSAKAHQDAAILLGESRLGWYRSGIIYFRGVAEEQSVVNHLIRLLGAPRAR